MSGKQKEMGAIKSHYAMLIIGVFLIILLPALTFGSIPFAVIGVILLTSLFSEYRKELKLIIDFTIDDKVTFYQVDGGTIHVNHNEIISIDETVKGFDFSIKDGRHFHIPRDYAYSADAREYYETITRQLFDLVHICDLNVVLNSTEISHHYRNTIRVGMKRRMIVFTSVIVLFLILIQLPILAPDSFFERTLLSTIPLMILGANVTLYRWFRHGIIDIEVGDKIVLYQGKYEYIPLEQDQITSVLETRSTYYIITNDGQKLHVTKMLNFGTDPRMHKRRLEREITELTVECGISITHIGIRIL